MKMPNEIYRTMLEETAELRDGEKWVSISNANRAYAKMLPNEPFVMVRRKNEQISIGYTTVIIPASYMEIHFAENPNRMENVIEVVFDSYNNLKAQHRANIKEMGE